MQVIVFPKHRGHSQQPGHIKIMTSSSPAIKLPFCWFYCTCFVCNLWRFIDSKEAVKRRSVFP